MGQVIGKALECLYNDKLWMNPKTLPETLEALVTREFKLALNDPKNFIDWGRSPSKDDLLQTCKNGILGYLKTMKANRLLGPYAESEKNLTGWLDKYTPIAGRPDLILRRDDTGVLILDGKNSKTPGKYTNPDQLRWYALCFYLAYHVLPDRLAFCYFRYPEGTTPPGHPVGEPWTGLVEVPVVKEDLKSLAHRAKETYKAISREMFDPTPSPKTCEFCDFETVCDARIQQKAMNAKKRQPQQDLLSGASGIVDLGFVSATSLTKKKK